MMGHYNYYYIDSPDDHDCMWSGDCCLISQTLIKQVVPDEAAAAAIAITASGKLTPLANGGGHQEATTTNATTTTATLTVTESTGDTQQVTVASSSPDLPVATLAATDDDGDDDDDDDNDNDGDNDAAENTTGATGKQQTATTVSANTRKKKNRQTANESSRGQLVANKKLRHREVEKNRHRQLQAMVKNISERIPGRLDKETQVQTMKRAARYCLYLRDAMNLLNHGQAQLQLQKVYLKAWDSVELMSQC